MIEHNQKCLGSDNDDSVSFVLFSKLSDPLTRRRFWAKVHRPPDPDACWLWTGAKGDKFGHGATTIRLHRGAEQAHLYAHRVSWMLAHGLDIPPGHQINHHCDVPACVRPDHLYLGTQLDNVRDGVRRGRYPKTRKFRKLSDASVQAIRSLSQSGTPAVRLAEAFNVSETTVSFILSGKRRQHVPDIVRASKPQAVARLFDEHVA